MGDIRDSLNERRNSLLEKISDHYSIVDRSSRASGNPNYDIGARAIDELRQIEAVIAQLQLADATRDAANAQEAATRAADRDRSLREGSEFWSRRLLTSLTIVSGGAAFGLASIMVRQDAPDVAPIAAVLTLAGFLLSMVVMGGVVPLLMETAHDANVVEKQDSNNFLNAARIATMSASVILIACLICAAILASVAYLQSPDEAVDVEVSLPSASEEDLLNIDEPDIANHQPKSAEELEAQPDEELDESTVISDH